MPTKQQLFIVKVFWMQCLYFYKQIWIDTSFVYISDVFCFARKMLSVTIKQWIVIFYMKLGKTAIIYWKQFTAMDILGVHVFLSGYSIFQVEWENVEDESCPGCTFMWKTDNNIEKISNLVPPDDKLSVCVIAKTLNMQKVCAKMVPEICLNKNGTDNLNVVENNTNLFGKGNNMWWIMVLLMTPIHPLEEPIFTESQKSLNGKM